MDDIRMSLTELQDDTLRVIFRYLTVKKYPPSIGEIQKELGVKNPGTIHRAVEGLEKKNYIIRLKDGRRNIRLTDLTKKINDLKEIPVIHHYQKQNRYVKLGN